MTNGLSQKRDSSQVLSPLQSKLFLIIWQQIQSHDRHHYFDLGATRRSHLFGDWQTYVAATRWSQLLECSPPYVTKLIRKLESIKLLRLIKMRQWKIVEVNFQHDEIKNLIAVSSDNSVGVSSGVSSDEFRVTNTKKTESNGRVSSGVSSAAQYKFVSSKERKASTKENKHSAAVETVSSEGKKQREQTQLLVKAELPEEQRSKRKAMRGVERAVDLLKNPALKKSHIHELIAFNDRLSELPSGILTHKPRIGLISRRCVGKWRQMANGNHRRHQFFETFLDDTDEIFDAIKRAEGAHGTNWFRFEWLLSFELTGNGMENQYGEHNIEKLLSGRYQRLNEWVADQRRLKVENRTNYEPAGNLFDNDSFI